MKKAKLLLTIGLMSFGALSMASCGNEKAACSHEYGSWSVSKAATCEEKGEKVRTCSKCGYAQKEAIAAKGHNYSNGVCTVCGKTKPSGDLVSSHSDLVFYI